MKQFFKKENVKLLNHNKKPFNEMVKILKQGNHNALVVQATGSGKSNIIMKYIDSYFKNKKILYVAPTKSIYNQLISYDGWNFNNVEFSTYMSLKKHNSNYYDLCIFDEAHRLMGKKTYKYAKSFYNNDKCEVIGLTATPKRLDKKDIRKDFFNESELINSIDLFEAIDRHILPKFKYCITVNKCEEFTNSVLKMAEKKFSDIIKVKDELKHCFKNQISIEDIIKENYPNAKKFLIFASTISECDQWKKEMINILHTNNISVVSSKNNIDDNINIIENFNKCNNKCALISVNMLSEGLHLNDLDCVIMLRHTNSERIFFQQIGRLISFKKKDGLIIDCVSNFKLMYDNIYDYNSTEENDANDDDYIISKHKQNYSKKKYLKQIIYKNYNIDLCKLYNDINSYKYSDEFINDLSDFSISNNDISKKYRISISTIANKRRVLGIQKRAAHINWTDDMINDLYNLSINEISKKYGIGKSSVNDKRKKLGIQKCVHINWTDDMINDLYNLSITDISKKYGISKTSVDDKRKKLGIQKYSSRTKFTDDAINDMYDFSISNSEISKKYGISMPSISIKRKKLGIQKCAHINWTDDMINDMYDFSISNSEISKKYGISMTSISDKRKELGIQKRDTCINWTDDMINDLRNFSISNSEISKKYGISTTPINKKRKELGIQKRAARINWTDDMINDLRNFSISNNEISKKYGICKSSVSNKRKKIREKLN